MYNSQLLDRFKQCVVEEPSLLIEGLWNGPKAALIKLIIEATSKNCLVILPDAQDTKLLDDCAYFNLTDAIDFPSWETLPGEEISPSPDIVGKRLAILHDLATQKKSFVLFASLQAVLQKTPEPTLLKKQCLSWRVGQKIAFDSLPTTLGDLGYRKRPVVADKGEFALRGGILDIFPLSSPEPYRIDFFGDEIEGIRTFDPIGQKSTGRVDSIFIPPAQEVALLNSSKALSTLFDYLGTNTYVILDNLLSLEDKLVALNSLPGAKSTFMQSGQELFEKIQTFSHLLWPTEKVEELAQVQLPHKTGRAYYSGKTPLQPLTFEFFNQNWEAKRWQHPFLEVQEILPSLSVTSTLKPHFICTTESEERALKEKISIPPQACFERGYLSSGFGLKDSDIALIPNTEFTNRYKVRRQKWRSTYHTPSSDFHELVPGDVIVHFHQGIGKFLGLEKQKNHLGEESEFLALEYAEKSKLFVPIAQSHLVSRYIGSQEEIPTLHTLGSKVWQKTRLTAQKAIIGYAQDLLKIDAERTIQGGFAYDADSEEMNSFEEDFSYVETEDQIEAIESVKRDMISSKAMDRLICGDVGYGKTEVAMRAAFKAVVDGKKQVAVLVPTTVLALQHLESFQERMVNHPINIKGISRFHSAKEIKQTLQEAAEGKVDILVGTHRLISKDVKFKDLGLIIIDEEQRFGVRAKQHLKALKTGVDCLTLTATPIPRTLYLSLVGAREISLINTPPQDRLPIKTIIAQKDKDIIYNALLRELSRDGQAFFIHNRVESIDLVGEEIQKLLPQARIVVGHGQMSADELDTVFHSFKSGKADILVATTIVESGIDIPNANTILIDRADRFGLADLYQLRGRVGRWNRPAYAYFLTPTHTTMPENARKRLTALAESSGYGGGMKLAMRDLEIRGAGDILGTQQSGQVATIGFHLYCKLLKRTIDALQKNAEPSFNETKMEFSFDARIPDSYIAESSLRLEMYHRLGEMENLEAVDRFLEELKDRFGPYPLPVVWLYHLTRIRIFASQKKIALIKIQKHTIYIEQNKGKEIIRQTVPLPNFSSPQQLEEIISQNIIKRFFQ